MLHIKLAIFLCCHSALLIHVIHLFHLHISPTTSSKHLKVLATLWSDSFKIPQILWLLQNLSLEMIVYRTNLGWNWVLLHSGLVALNRLTQNSSWHSDGQKPISSIEHEQPKPSTTFHHQPLRPSQDMSYLLTPSHFQLTKTPTIHSNYFPQTIHGRFQAYNVLVRVVWVSQ